MALRSEFSVIDPATGEAFASITAASVAEGIDAVGVASDAFPRWANTTSRHRAEVLARAFDAITAQSEILAKLIVRESGKPIAEARGEVAYAAEFVRWFSEEAVRVGGMFRRAPTGSVRTITDIRPIGVALLVTPWNFPAAMVTRKVAPALAAGCSVVLKPAEETPCTALELVKIFHKAGVPTGVLNVVTTNSPATVVEAMLEQPAVRKLSFTGSTEVGRMLLEKAAQRVVSCSMELGGNAPFIVLPDADLVAAVKDVLVAKLRNSGQTCTAVNRVLVHTSVAQDFVRALTTAFENLNVGPGAAPTSDVDPLVTGQARARVEQLVESAVEKGAKIATGGSAPERPGCFYLPTVLTGVQHRDELVMSEIFGPVAPVITFDDDEEAVAIAKRH